jgi:GNAT superfamily N-acetyltransferase
MTRIIEVLSAPHAARIDAAWVKSRAADAPERHWRWQQIHYACTAYYDGDAFAVVDDGVVVAAWGTATPMTRHQCYVVDYFEVAPSVRGQGVGRSMFFDGVRPRAIDQNARAIVLGAVTESVRFYERLGLQPCPSQFIVPNVGLFRYGFSCDDHRAHHPIAAAAREGSSRGLRNSRRRFADRTFG